VCACWDAGFRPRPRHAAAASASAGRATRPPAHSPVTGGGSSEIAKGARRCPQVGNRLWAKPVTLRPRACSWSRSSGQGSSPVRETGSRLVDGRHLGCGGSRPLFAEERVTQPWVGSLKDQPRTGRGPDRAGVSSRRGSGSMTRGVRADRVGEKLSSGRPQGRRPKRGGPRREGRPWPVKTRLVIVRAAGRGFGPDLRRSSAGRKVGEGPARRHHPSLVQGLSLSCEASVARAGAACELRGSGAGERSARAHARAARDGDQAVVWVCSRVVVVAEVDERRLVQTCQRVRGLAPWLPFAGAPGAKGRRKPGRGGESHEHASSDTGGGLLVIPRAERESGTRDRGREHSAMEDVLAQRRAAAFDEAAAARGTAIRGDGDAVLPARERPGPRRIAKKDVRGSVASPAHGRQHRGR